MREVYKHGYLYMAEREDGLYKVGFTGGNPIARCKALSGTYKQTVTLLASWKIKNAFQIETAVHRKLTPYRAKQKGNKESYKTAKINILSAINEIISNHSLETNFSSTLKEKNIGVRLTPDAAKALQKAASSDKRTISWLAALFIEDALRKAGWLK